MKNVRPFMTDGAPLPDLHVQDEDVVEKQSEIFHNGIGPDLEEMAGNSHDFIQHNTMRFYRWLKDAKNWRRMDIGTWKQVQKKFAFIENKMHEVESWENGGDPHDRIDMNSDLNFLFVKRMMAENPATLDDAMDQWKTEREARNEEHMTHVK